MTKKLHLIKPYLILLMIFASACHSRKGHKDKDEIELEQNIANNRQQRDSVFLHFEKNWTKFINRSPELIKKVMPRDTANTGAWEPVITSDCIYQSDAQVNVPVVDLSWNSVILQQPLRFDIALHYQGFEKNYYTTVFPVEKEKRFNIPLESRFLVDTASVLLTGPPLFPRIETFVSQALKDTAGLAVVKSFRQGAAIARSTLRLRDLGPGLSYRIRMCTFANDVWTPTREVIFTTPICPVDYK